MNTTLEIPQEEWRAFFDGLSRRHRGSRVSLEVIDSEAGVGEEARNMVLEGALAEVRHGEESVSILVGQSPEHHLSHTIHRPTHVRLRRAQSGETLTLQVESPTTTTLLHFLFPAQPEVLEEDPSEAERS